jgi:hypothetical protein
VYEKKRKTNDYTEKYCNTGVILVKAGENYKYSQRIGELGM